MKFDREFRPMLPQKASHPFQDLYFHSLNVDFDSVDAVFRSSQPRPEPIEARREKPLLELLAFECTVDHAPHHRKTPRGKISALAQPDGHNRQLLKSIAGPGSRDAARRPDHGFESIYSSGGADELAKCERRISVMRAYIQPCFSAPDISREPGEQGQFRAAKNCRRVVVPGGHQAAAAQRAAENPALGYGARQETAETGFQMAVQYTFRQQDRREAAKRL